MKEFYHGETFINFFPDRLTSYRSIKMYFYGLPTDVLINFFIPLGRAETIIRENLVPAKRDSSRKTEGSRENKTEFHPGQPGSCNNHLI